MAIPHFSPYPYQPVRSRFLILVRLIISATLVLATSSCISVQGQSTSEMKKAFESSYVYKSAKRFYPDGMPQDPSAIYPSLSGAQLTPIEDELKQVANAIRVGHGERKQYANDFLGQLASQIATSSVKVVATGKPRAYTSEDGTITVDVRVLQAIFRGALLSNGSDDTFGDVTTLPLGDEAASYSPDNETVQQREQLQSLLDIMHTVESTPGSCLLADIIGSASSFDGPWFKLSEIQMKTQNLQITYIGALLFLLAHEHGHLALHHHAVATALRSQFPADARNNDSEFCVRKREIELQADAYALLLLSPYLGKSALPPFADGFSFVRNVTGYRSFFEYGYRLSGFEENDDTCKYPSQQERLQTLLELDRVLVERSATAFLEALERSLKSTH